MTTWKAPREPEKKPESPKPHRPPHEATYEGLAHVSEQIEALKAQLDRIEAKLSKS
jgi:hypothetical protein